MRMNQEVVLPTPPDAPGIIRHGVLARNTLLNLVGHAAAAVMAVVAIPILLEGLGPSRFGVLMLVWAAIGYFSLLDLGLGRALTQLISERLGRGAADDVAALAWTALILTMGSGVAGTILLLFATPTLADQFINAPQELASETRTTIYLLALSLPAVIGTAALKGILEAFQRFDVAVGIGIPTGAFSFFGPLLVLPFSASLPAIVAVIAAGRLLALAVHLAACLHLFPDLRRGVAVRADLIPSMLRFGGWMTVSNVISPIMVFLDRFYISSAVSVAAVSYYATVYEVATKLWIVPIALLGVFFPAFASTFVRSKHHALNLFHRALRFVLLAVFPLGLLLITFAPEGLNLWLGSEFAQQSTPVLRWLTAGVLLNCAAQIPYAAIQGIGRPDLTGKLHLVELPFYVFGLWVLVGRFGIMGAAAAWTLRAVVDTAVLYGIAARQLHLPRTTLAWLGASLFAAMLVFFTVSLVPDLAPRSALALGALLIFMRGAWIRILTPEERSMFRRAVRARLVASPGC